MTPIDQFKHEMTLLVEDIRNQIMPEFQAFEDDPEPGIQLTIGYTTDSDWDYQTGDNSYFGAAYHHKAWAVIGVYQDSGPDELAREIVDQIQEQMES